jgi:hypothetical protein
VFIIIIIERFNFKRLNEVEHIEQYWVEISDRLASLENLEMMMWIAWETVMKNINISAKENLGHYELKKHEPWFSDGRSELFNERKEADYNGYRIQIK